MTIKRARYAMTTGLFVAVAALTFNATSAQTTIKPGFNLFSTDQDMEIGRQSALEVERQLPIINDRAAQATVEKNGKVIFRYQLPDEIYRVGQTPAEAFASVLGSALSEE